MGNIIELPKRDYAAEAYSTVRDATYNNENITRAEAMSILMVIQYELAADFNAITPDKNA